MCYVHDASCHVFVSHVVCAEQARLSDLQEQLSAIGGLIKVSGANVGSLVGLQADEIKRAAEDYLLEMKRKEEEMGDTTSRRGQEMAHQRQVRRRGDKARCGCEEFT